MLEEIFFKEISVNIIAEACIVMLIFLALKNLFVKIIMNIMRKLSEKYNVKVVSVMIDAIEKPLKTFFKYAGVYFALAILPLNGWIYALLYRVFRTFVIILITQGLLNIINIYSVLQNDTLQKTEGKAPLIKTLYPLLSKVIKALIILISIVAIAAEFDFKQLNSILAGVGIGGVAVAFAAQDLLKNFFGGFIVLTDQSFNVGDFIKVDTNEGTVEELGIRSTKVRTLEQELIIIPNSKFADGAVINYTKRNLRRASFNVGATYGTSSKQLKSVIEKIKAMINEHPQVKCDSALVKFNKFADSSMEILIQYLVETSDYREFMTVKDAVNFGIMDIFESEAVSFAFPSMSVYMEKHNDESSRINYDAYNINGIDGTRPIHEKYTKASSNKI